MTEKRLHVDVARYLNDPYPIQVSARFATRRFAGEVLKSFRCIAKLKTAPKFASVCSMINSVKW